MRLSRAALALAWGAVASLAAAQQGSPSETQAQQAGKVVQAIRSQMSSGQWAQTVQLLEQFVQKYSTHELVPWAYMTMAENRRALNDPAGELTALEEVIGRFYPAGAWFEACRQKLDILRNKKDPDEYIKLMEFMQQKAGRLPLSLQLAALGHDGHGIQSRFSLYEVEWAFRGQVVGGRDWIGDAARLADTPQRAQQVLQAIAPTLRAEADNLPPAWQHAHVQLLETAGKQDDAEKAFRDYLQGWADDPRGMALWVFRMQDAQAAAQAAKDPQVAKDLRARAEEAWKVLIDQYGGSASLAELFWQRLAELANTGRYEDFKALGAWFVKTYGDPSGPGGVMDLWLLLAQPRGEKKDDFSRIDEALEFLKPFENTAIVGLQRAILTWKIELLLRKGKVEEAVVLAGGLTDQKHWSAATYEQIKGYVRRSPAFQSVQDAVQEKWSIHPVVPDSPTAAKLKELQGRLKENETRHAEEIAEELFSQNPDDGATVEAVKALADYYFAKVQRDPRDKWISRMVQSYPYHPLAEAVRANKIHVDRAEKRPEDMGTGIDTVIERFPGCSRLQWQDYRMEAFAAAKDGPGRLKFIQMLHGPSADAGDQASIEQVGRYETAELETNKAVGDYWMARAGRIPNTRAAACCLCRAWQGYGQTGGDKNPAPCVEGLLAALTAMQTQTLDPEMRWKMQFMDIPVRADNDPKAALEALSKRLEGGRKYRGLSNRLNILRLVDTLYKAGLLAETEALVNRLQGLCVGDRDEDIIAAALGSVLTQAKNYPAAAERYLGVVRNSPWPIQEYWFFRRGLDCQAQVGPAAYAGTLQDYIQSLGNAQNLVPELMYELGAHCFRSKNPAVLQVREALARRFPASSYLDNLDAMLSPPAPTR